MITKEQLDVVQRIEKHHRDIYIERGKNADLCREIADALAAAIATIEGLHKTADGHYIAAGTELFYATSTDLYRGMYDGSWAVQLHRVNPDNSLCSDGTTGHVSKLFTTAAAARGEVEGA